METTMMKTMKLSVLAILASMSIACAMEDMESGKDVMQANFEDEVRAYALIDSGDERDAHDDALVLKGPAPALSYLEVVAVCSEQFDPSGSYCEGVSQGAFSTSYNHGGAWMEVVTDEFGYRSFGYATMNGNSLTELGNVPWVDASGVVVGWRRWWSASGHQNGNFSYDAYSINMGGWWSDALYIY